MATLDEWLPLEQFLKRQLRRKAQSFKRLFALDVAHECVDAPTSLRVMAASEE
jgi:hypothetical protein